MAGGRPETTGPAWMFYNSDEAKKYARSSRMKDIQYELAARAMELLDLPTPDENTPPSLILDVGCGTGMSGEVISEFGHNWIGMDISQDMLKLCDNENLVGKTRVDAGEGVPFRAGVFDAVISISAIQWLCYSNANHEEPVRRLKAFFSTLYTSLNRGGKAVLQFYPDNDKQLELIEYAALSAGFTGGTLTDFPESAKAKKHYLVLFTGAHAAKIVMPEALTDDSTVKVGKRTHHKNHEKIDTRAAKGSKEWILKKKQKHRELGKNVSKDSKYTGRRRKDIAI